MTETHYQIKGCPASIALLSDTHNTDPAPILASLRSHAPALIALTGDFVRGRKPSTDVRIEDSQNALTLMTACAALAPTFVSIGNHDACLSREDLDTIRSTGVTLLENSYVTHFMGGKRTVIGGLSSGYYTVYQQCRLTENDVKSPAPDTGWLERFAAEEGFHILLMHHPENFCLIPPAVELAMAGHAHGGQWRFYDLRTKQWRGVYAPDQGLFPKLTGGVTDGRLVVSRGLSNPAGLPRICNDTEIVYIESS